MLITEVLTNVQPKIGEITCIKNLMSAEVHEPSKIPLTF
jgi:hypothetical protein